MANGAFSWINYVDDGFAQFSVGSQVDLLPATNVADARVQKVWRTAGTTTDWIQIDFGSLQDVQIVGVFGVNLSASDTVRYRLATTVAGLTGTPDYDSGILASGATVAIPQHVLILPAVERVRYIRIDLSAPTTVAFGAIDVGRVWVGQIDWQPSVNFDYGAQILARSLSSVVVSGRSGVTFADQRRNLRGMAFELSHVSPAERVGPVATIETDISYHRQILFIPDPDDDVSRAAILGYFREIGATRYAAFGSFSKPLRIEEAG